MGWRAKVVVGIAIVAAGGIWILARPPAKHNSVAFLARRYGVSKDSVRDVAHAFGVDPENMASYGERSFPGNYIEYTLGWKWDQAKHPTVYRAEIEALMTGYVSRCDIEDTITIYLFYSDWLRPKTLFRGEALPIEIFYELDVAQDGVRSDHVVQDIAFYSVGDSGGWPWEQVAPHCDPPAKY
jgi:hypothetical protein